jgi:hypothetical protein
MRNASELNACDEYASGRPVAATAVLRPYARKLLCWSRIHLWHVGCWSLRSSVEIFVRAVCFSCCGFLVRTRKDGVADRNKDTSQ